MSLSTKSAARNALSEFIPKSGEKYAVGRNYDNGPGREATVSKLSPWMRVRALPEWEVISAVLNQKSASEASKFIDEVCWRTYWKGWLQMRPSIWSSYLQDRAEILEQHSGSIAYQEAVDGRTGIDCFDTWNRELVEKNYLHNHARMWYASIWVHTLKLPWQLGADWFLRHLLDGDPASNTLSWRWVTGLHTNGKTYLARPDNIRKYTNGRFKVTRELANETIPVGEISHPKPRELEPNLTPPQKARIGLLITDDDLSASNWLAEKYPCVASASLHPEKEYRNHNIQEPVLRFRREMMLESSSGPTLKSAESVLEWAQSESLDGILTTASIVGFNAPLLDSIRERLKAEGKQLYSVRHWWDATLFPHATHGFFRFKKAIPGALEQIQQPHLESLER